MSNKTAYDRNSIQRRHPSLKTVMAWMLAILTVSALMTVSQVYFDNRSLGRDLPLLYPLVWEFTGHYSVWLAVPVLFWFIKRYPVRRQRIVFWILLHFAASFVFSVVITTTFYYARLWLYDLLNLGRYSYGNLYYRYIFEFHKMAIGYWAFYGGLWLYSYVLTNREREVRTARMEAQLNQARLDVLKTQINPHFLFNTLNTISSVMYEDPKAADRMISLLSQMLRRTLERSVKQLVPLIDEVELLDLYFGIMKARFQEKLSIRMEVLPHCSSSLVPSFLLQPLVENSIKFNPPVGTATAEVTVRAVRLDSQLVIVVEDNGPGLPADFKPGTGLTNVRKRLEHLYGSEHVLELNNRPEGGLKVTMRIPYLEPGAVPPRLKPLEVQTSHA